MQKDGILKGILAYFSKDDDSKDCEPEHHKRSAQLETKGAG